MSERTSENILIIDGQVFQTPAWHRGMGKYSFNLLDALFKSKQRKNYSKIIILLNENLSLEDDCEKKLKKIATNVEFTYVNLEVSKNKKIVEVQPVNKKILQNYIDANFKDVTIDFLVLCLFLGETTCIVFPDNVRKLLLFYDLIPFLYSERYINRIPYDDYLANFKAIFEADMLFSISQTVADDLAIYLGVSHKKITNINGAAIDRSQIPSSKLSIDIDKPYILMPSGDELRKNNTRAVKGFEQFNQAHGNKYKLVLTSFFGEQTVKDLHDISENIIFTGNIAEAELQWLYENAELVLFASEYEGLGLPVLEAMTVGKKIACSDIPVFKEISKDAFYYFDQLRPSAIALGIAKALNDSKFEQKQSKYGSLLASYTWENSASHFYEGIQKLPSNTKPNVSIKPRLAIFTPDPSGFSAIGKVVAESHAAMSELFDIDYYFDSGLYHRVVRPDYLSSVANCFPANEFNALKYANYETVIYHIGNSDYHLETIKNALHLPGYAVLHDTFLDGAYERLEIDGYMTPNRIELEKILNKMVKPIRSQYLTTTVNAQIGVIGHSKYTIKAAEQIISNDLALKKVELPVGTPMITNRKGNDEKLNICFAGIFADVKGLEIIEQIARSLGSDGGEISIFGFNFAEPDSIERLKELSNVRIIANPTDFEFQTLLAKQDVLVNYRLEYKGETSLTTLEAMRYGVVPIVRDIGWYSELPNESVVKLAAKEQVLETIMELFADREKLNQISKAALHTVRDKFSHEKYAQDIAELIAQELQADKPNNRVANQLKRRSTAAVILKQL